MTRDGARAFASENCVPQRRPNRSSFTRITRDNNKLSIRSAAAAVGAPSSAALISRLSGCDEIEADSGCHAPPILCSIQPYDSRTNSTDSIYTHNDLPETFVVKVLIFLVTKKAKLKLSPDAR